MAVYILDADHTEPSATGLINPESGVAVDWSNVDSDTYSQDIGDGSSTSIVVTHNLNTRDVSLEIYRNEEPYDTVRVDAKNTTKDTVTLTFAVPPAENEYRIVIRPVPLDESLVFDVTDFVAIGNGVADDAPAIQAALDACAGTGGTVLFPSGMTFYCVTPASTINILVIGSDTNILATGAYLKRGINSRQFVANWAEPTDETPGYTGASNITIDGGTWDSNPSVATGNNCFVFSHCENITIKNCLVKDVMRVHGIDAGGVRNLRIDNCIFQGTFYSTASDTIMYREAIQIDHCWSGNGHNLPADKTVCDNVLISNCISRTTPTAAPAGFVGGPPASFAGQHSMAGDPGRHTRVHFLNNIVEDCRYAGFRIMGMASPVVEGNIIRRSGSFGPVGAAFNAGISVDLYGSLNSTDVRILSNKFSGAGMSPRVAGTDSSNISINAGSVTE